MSQPTPVTHVESILGEGAIWHQSTLYWVDILGKMVHSYDPSTGTHRALSMPQCVGTVVPRASGGLVVALEAGFAHVEPSTGQVRPLGEPVDPRPETRFNDGKCDPAGRLWVGTMGFNSEPGMGSLYMLDVNGRVEVKIPSVTVSNGICWSSDARTMYYIDTPTQEVWAFDYDVKTGAISNRRVAVQIPKREGSPDGMTIDADGNLWVALWGGSAVACYDPASGKLITKIELPCEQVTSCAFGGPDLEDLYITTARVGYTPEKLAQQPLAGRLFHVRPGVKGLPAFAYAG